jgi:succinate dehydrogenase/fumarate reductase cytochrome b subunit
MGWAILKDANVAKTLLLIPASWPSVQGFAKSFAWSVSALLYKAQQHNAYILGRLPILELAQSMLAIIGVYAIWNKARKEIYGLISLILISVVLAALNKNVILLTLALPSILIFASAGLRYLYMRWRKIFPLNPLPRALAIILVIALVCAHMAYGIRYALIAWPHNPDTRNTYQIK